MEPDARARVRYQSQASVVAKKKIGLGLLAAVALLAIAAFAMRGALYRALMRPSGRGGAPKVLGPVDPLAWPSPEAKLRLPTASFPPGFGKRRIAVDAGHGAPKNKGNTSCFCVDEQDFTLEAANALAERLRATGYFEVLLSRQGDAQVEYKKRAEEAARWGAEVLVSLHSDVRGKFDQWAPEPGKSCPMSLAAPGFSVLWSDEGDPALTGVRLALARGVARRMAEAGFTPYLGGEYTGLYEADPEQPGVFVDRHEPGSRIFILRRPSMPSILIETHHALDPREAARWREEATFDAFAAATIAALADVLGGTAERATKRP
ncbi:MAG TPA: N-acetylmuramoyl-L-alanine amidase [Polyangiaceae bacterium]|nr:N-acetylmuramoyl-L-alanine amidase [Polyangiaceae bacterium]